MSHLCKACVATLFIAAVHGTQGEEAEQAMARASSASSTYGSSCGPLEETVCARPSTRSSRSSTVQVTMMQVGHVTSQDDESIPMADSQADTLAKDDSAGMHSFVELRGRHGHGFPFVVVSSGAVWIVLLGVIMAWVLCEYMHREVQVIKVSDLDEYLHRKVQVIKVIETQDNQNVAILPGEALAAAPRADLQ